MHESKPRSLVGKIEWDNLAFLTLTPLVGLFSLALFIFKGWIRWETIALTLLMAVATGIAITGGYHRLFSHKTYEVNAWLKLLYLVFGAAAFQNSARRWSSDHRRHHRFVDTEKDPYNIKKGFWYAHMGWIFMRYGKEHSYDDVPDLTQDPLIQFQEKYYIPLAIFMGFIGPAGVAAFWGDFWGGLLIAGCVRIVVNHHFTFFINSLAHLVGRQPYSDADTSRDNWFLALVTYGEGYHNFHHKFPRDYRNGIRPYQWDPTKWFIKGCSWLGWSRHLNTTGKERIIRARLIMDEKRMLGKLERKSSSHERITREIVTAAREKFEKAYAQFRASKIEFRRIRKKRLFTLNSPLTAFNERVANIKRELAHSQRLLKEAGEHWGTLCRGLGVRPTKSFG